jgi:hypothetical protein
MLSGTPAVAAVCAAECVEMPAAMAPAPPAPSSHVEHHHGMSTGVVPASDVALADGSSCCSNLESPPARAGAMRVAHGWSLPSVAAPAPAPLASTAVGFVRAQTSPPSPPRSVHVLRI